jgi:hypothetical protein
MQVKPLVSASPLATDGMRMLDELTLSTRCCLERQLWSGQFNCDAIDFTSNNATEPQVVNS